MSNEADIEESRAPLIAHLTELRDRLIKALIAFALCFVLCFYFATDIYDFLTAPLRGALIERNQDPRLVFTALQEVFFTDLRLSLFLKPGSTSGPSRVAAQLVLFRRWNVSRCSIGKFKIEGRSKRTLPFQFQAGDAINFIWHRSDSQITNPDCLQNHLSARMFVNPLGLLGVHLHSCAWQQFAAGCIDWSCPLPTVFGRFP